MLYEAKFSAAEIDLLASLIDQPLEGVLADGSSVKVCAANTVLSIVQEDVATPDADHPHGDVDRPLVRAGGDLWVPETAKVVGERLGLVRSVNVVAGRISRVGPTQLCKTA